MFIARFLELELTSLMGRPGTKVTFFLEKRKSLTQPLERIVLTENYGIAQEVAEKQLILEGIDPSQYKRVILSKILILEVDSDGRYNEEHF